MPPAGSNSTKALRDAVNFARAFPELSPVLGAGGFADQPARDIGGRVMNAMLAGGFVDGKKVGPFPWKWNRVAPPKFLTNAWQQDYASLGFNTLEWLQHGIIIDINNSAPRQPYWDLEVVRDLPLISLTTGGGRPTQVCWLNNRDLQYGVWGGGVTSGVGNQNPAAGSVYANPLGAASPPGNPVTQIIDANGNFLVLTGYGSEGSAAPVLSANATPGATVSGTGATTVWRVADPYGQGFRLAPPPPQLALTYQVNLVGQARPLLFATLAQLLNPIPDDFSTYFFDGFVVEARRRSPDRAARMKADDDFKYWMLGLQEALGKADTEREAYGFYPDSSVMDPYPVAVKDAGWPFAPTGM
jgi:hypothetical protein